MLPAQELHRLAQASGDPAVDYAALVRDAFDAIPSTPDLAARLAAASGGRVRHHHVADPCAGMAEQINAAAAAEFDRLAATGVEPARVWVGIYNADSRPHPDTLTALAALAALAVTEPDARVVQQSALFTANLRARPGLGGVFCDGAALLQSRWTLAREIPRLRAQARQARRSRARWPRVAHCVGHGLFVRGDTWRMLGGLPTATMNEDLALGYQLSAAQVPDDPLPLIEYAEAPDTASAVVRQTRQSATYPTRELPRPQPRHPGRPIPTEAPQAAPPPRVWDRAYSTLCNRYGTTLARSDRHRLVGLRLDDLGHALAHLLHQPGRHQQLATEIHDLIAGNLGRAVTPMPGAVGLLTSLASHRPLAVASNSPRTVVTAHLTAAGLADAFEIIIGSDDVDRPKPAPDIYLAACGHLGVDPATAVAVEDSPTGAGAARAAGMYVIGIPSAPDLTLAVDALYPSLADPRIHRALTIPPPTTSVAAAAG